MTLADTGETSQQSRWAVRSLTQTCGLQLFDWQKYNFTDASVSHASRGLGLEGANVLQQYDGEGASMQMLRMAIRSWSQVVPQPIPNNTVQRVNGYTNLVWPQRLSPQCVFCCLYSKLQHCSIPGALAAPQQPQTQSAVTSTVCQVEHCMMDAVCFCMVYHVLASVL